MLRDLVMWLLPTDVSVPTAMIGPAAALLGLVAVIVAAKLSTRVVATVAARRPARPAAAPTIIHNAQGVNHEQHV